MQAEPAAGPETAEHVPQVFVVQTETLRESQTQTLQSCGKVQLGIHYVEEEGVVEGVARVADSGSKVIKSYMYGL